MAVAVSHKDDPVSTVVQELQRALDSRAQGVVWRATPAGLAAGVPEGTLLLTPLPGTSGWKLTVVFEGKPGSSDVDTASTERGRRVIAWGALGRMQQRAHELAMRGVPGGPAYLGGDPGWYAIEHDQSLRMAGPDGELRISPLEGDLWILVHEDVHGVEVLDFGARSELMNQAVPLCLTRATRPLQICINDRQVHLRPIAVPGVLGYYEPSDGALWVLAFVEGCILLVDARGAFHRVLARLSWTDLQFGETVEVRPSHAGARSGEGPSPELRVLLSSADTAERPASGPEAVAGPAASSQSSAVDDSADHPPMNERHRALCQRYFQRLHQRLRGRGARKARMLVLLLVEGLERCREDITGSRTEVHARMAKLLKRPLPGGPRNARDCLDLLMRSSPLARSGPDKQCTLLFGQLHDPNSELIRLIAAEDAREQAAANGPPAEAQSSKATSESKAVDPPSKLIEGSSATTEQSELSSPDEPGPRAGNITRDAASEAAIQHQSKPDPERMLLEVYRYLGIAAPGASGSPGLPRIPEETPTRTPVLAPTPPSPQIVAPDRSSRKRRKSIRAPTYFLGEPVYDDDEDDDDDDAPSRYRGSNPDDSPPFLD